MNLLNSSRQIRVFISSTFRDMQAERDHLVKFVFPQLRKLCESRGVVWGEVDLRWGVTDEQAAEGKVLPICLEEIKRCRPYFIGLLGERYGWIPETLPADLLEREEWLEEHLNGKTSVTELEILHGVLRNPQMDGHAYFYFRNPAFQNSILEEDRRDFAAENAKAAEKLRALKENIRRSGFPVRENYPDPKALGELVLADLTKVINDNWPEGSQLDPLDREVMDHEAYAQSRERVYIGRQEYFDRLDTHATACDTQPLVILGESGSGKSALLANWVARYQQAHSDALVFQHYIGATSYSADWAEMLRRLIGEFKRQLRLQQDIPDEPGALRSAFPNWLYMAAAAVGRAGTPPPVNDSPADGAHGVTRPTFKNIIIVLDALNQLEDRDGAPDLVWLPSVLPENVRLIVSTLPGRPLDEILKRNWPTLKVELLAVGERRKLIAEYLAQHAKSLNTARVERIAAAPPSANPLYLRVLLDELRLVRTHEELEERIGNYLKAESPYALYEGVIARWEQDYEGDSDLVGDTLSLLWAARRGLTETELLQALGKDGEPLPRARWSPLFLAMSDALISRGGLLTFAHDFFRTAVENDYLPAEQNQQQAHSRLADFFERQSSSLRRTDELPWQLCRGESWQKLHELLRELPFLAQLYTSNASDVLPYWTKLEDYSKYRLLDVYKKVFEDPASHENIADYLAQLALELGRREEASALFRQIVKCTRTQDDKKRLAKNLGNLAQLLMREDRAGNAEAMELIEEQERLAREAEDAGELRKAMVNQAIFLIQSGNEQKATVLLTQLELVCSETHDEQLLQRVLFMQAHQFKQKKEWHAALEKLKQQEQLCRKLGNQEWLGMSLHEQAHHYDHLNIAADAWRFFKESERIFHELCLKHRLLWTLSCMARFSCIGSGLVVDGVKVEIQSRVLPLLEFLNDELKANDIRVRVFKRLAEQERDDPGTEAKKHEEELHAQSAGEVVKLQEALFAQGEIRRRRKDLNGAMLKYQEQEKICRTLIAGRQHLDFLLAQSRHDSEAEILVKIDQSEAKFQILSRDVAPDSALRVLALKTTLLRRLGDTVREAAILTEFDEISKHSGQTGLKKALFGQAGILACQNQEHAALKLLIEQAEICRELGELDALARSLGLQAAIHYDWRDFGSAVQGLREQERLCRRSRNKRGVLASLRLQARIAMTQNEADKAIALLEESVQISRDLSDVDAERQFLDDLNRARKAL